MNQKKNQPHQKNRRQIAAQRYQKLQREGRAFRKNSVISGSQSSGVTSAAEETGQLKSSRVMLREYREHRQKLYGGIAVVSVALLVVLFLLFQFSGSVSTRLLVADSAESEQLKPQLVQRTEEYFTAKPYQRFRFLLNERALTAFLQEKYPEIEKVQTTDFAGFAHSQISLKVREPVASWTIDNVRYMVDKNGATFTRNLYPHTTIVPVIDQSGLPVSGDGRVATDHFMQYIGRLVSLDDKFGLDITDVIVPEGVAHEVDVRLRDKKYIAKFLIDRSPAEQLQDLAKAVQFIEKKGGGVKYIDVRTPERVFYQ